MQETTTTTTTKQYVCNGSCGAKISAAQYTGGITVCGTEGCTLKGHPFVEKVLQTTQETVKADTGEDVIINN